MATVNFLYRSKKEKAPLNLRLLFRDNNKDFVIGGKTKLIINKDYWINHHDKKRLRDIELVNMQTDVNNELNKIQNHILEAFNNSHIKEIDKNWLSKEIEKYYNPKNIDKEIPLNLVDYIEYYIDYRKYDKLSKATLTKYRVIKNKLIKFEEETNKTILIKNINEEFKNEFLDFQKKDGYAQNTIHKELNFIKTFCKHARERGLDVDKQLDKLKINKEKVEKIYLSFDEIEKIEKLSNLPQHLENARQWLIISCFTGQRISDFLRFDKDMIREEKGKKVMEFTQQKTGNKMTLPLFPKVISILEENDGDFPPKMSDQKYNKHIKTVCELAEINQLVKGSMQLEQIEGSGKYRKVSGKYEKYKLVTSHIGRRSFATNHYGKIPTNYLIYMTGHSSEKMFLNYIGKSNKDLAFEIFNYM